MADYKLVYLNYRGRAELIRFILAHAGVAYEDSRIDTDSWLKQRPGILCVYRLRVGVHAFITSRNAVWTPSLLGDKEC